MIRHFGNNLLYQNIINKCVFSTKLSTWSPLAIAFNTRPAKKLDLSLVNDSTGLFDIPELQSQEGFYALKEKCNVHAESLIQEVLSQKRSRKLVEVFDDLSDTLCRVADLAEFIRVAHPVAEVAHSAEVACIAVSGLVEKLNTNQDLYNALKDVTVNGDKFPTDAVDDHVAKLFLFDFEQSGIHLPDTERARVVSLNDSILQLGQHFVNNSGTPRSIKKSILPQSIRHFFPIDGGNAIVSGLHAESSNPLVRELAYRVFLHPDEHQEYFLMELLKCRYELAQVCGFPTYAHRALRGSLAETPEMVMNFLNFLSEHLKPRAKAEFEVMATLKRAEIPESGPLAVWDIPYYSQKAKKEWFKVNSADYSPYFSIGACMDGLNKLLSNLYGISLVNIETEPGEVWANDVYKLAVTHEQEGLLGYIYCDFYEREGKPNQECHFTIQGGRKLPDGSYQLPIVVVMLNLSLNRWSGPTLLSPGMVDNLFHEMGHAMHSMLARTKYQHITGTRCSTDFAEVPSVLMEYFSGDPRILRTFAKHFQTGEPMPEEMLQRLCTSKHIFSASEMQNQIFYSALDQIYHQKHPLEATTTEVLAKVQEKYYQLPYVRGTAWQLRFSHLVGYGAKYYSYLVSRALASWIWQTYFEADPQNRENGELYRKECLAHGGGKPPKQLVADYLKRDPTPEMLAESLLNEVESRADKLTNMVEMQT